MEMTGLSICSGHKKEVVITRWSGFHYSNKTFFTRLEVFRRAGVYLKINIKR